MVKAHVSPPRLGLCHLPHLSSSDNQFLPLSTAPSPNKGLRASFPHPALSLEGRDGLCSSP